MNAIKMLVNNTGSDIRGVIHPLWRNKRTGQLWSACEWRGEIILSFKSSPGGDVPASTTRTYSNLAEVEARYTRVEQ